VGDKKFFPTEFFLLLLVHSLVLVIPSFSNLLKKVLLITIKTEITDFARKKNIFFPLP